MKKNFHERAFEEYSSWQAVAPKVLTKINKLIRSIERDGALKGEGKPEKLKGRKGQYSRRIDDVNRIVY
jgi:toxin YoeB